VYVFADRRDAQNEDQHSLVAFDAAGHIKPGWPIEESPASDFDSLAVGPDGSVYVVECGEPMVGCVLHRLGADGRELPGWPFGIPDSSACLEAVPCVIRLIVGSDRTVYLTSWHQTQDQTQIIAIDAAGEIRPGWPIAVREPYGWFSYPQLGSDGTLFILSRPDGSEGQAILSAFEPDGSLRPGWPVPITGGYILGPEGTVVVTWGVDDTGELCTNFRRTVFTVLGTDGRTLPGWPRGSKGTASGPAVAADGTVYYVSALGNVYAHDRAGEVKAGWPVSVPGVFPGCGRYGPFLSADGTVFVLGDEVVAISPNGNSWRYRPQGALRGTSCDTDSSNRPAPAFGSDGTIYLSVFDSTLTAESVEVVALDREGRVKSGWPYRLPIDGRTSDVGSLDVSPDGRLYVATGACGPEGVAMLFALDPDGRISD
jgi:outer membrane protein assembly factor BamB